MIISEPKTVCPRGKSGNLNKSGEIAIAAGSSRKSKISSTVNLLVTANLVVSRKRAQIVTVSKAANNPIDRLLRRLINISL
tara:strand:+ start:89 stop:331 length:243 start_codon:yes stop_codon:yes gene_type:complete